MVKITLYVDKKYYSNVYKGNMLSSVNNYEQYFEQSQEIIDSITFNRINQIGFDNLSMRQQEYIKKAICAQADYIYEYGYNAENENDIQSYDVLDIKINMKNDRLSKASKLHLSERAYFLIHQTGLDCRIL